VVGVIVVGAAVVGAALAGVVVAGVVVAASVLGEAVSVGAGVDDPVVVSSSEPLQAATTTPLTIEPATTTTLRARNARREIGDIDPVWRTCDRVDGVGAGGRDCAMADPQQAAAASVTAPVTLDGFNPFSPAAQQCPHLYYRAMQAEAPVFHPEGTDLYMVTRHSMITPILRDTATFSSRFGSAGELPKGDVVERIRAVLAEGWPQVPTMLTIDPPDHTRFRGTVAPWFTPRRMADLRAPVERIVTRLIDQLPDHPVDVVTAFAVPLPVEVIAHVLDVAPDRLDDFKRWSDDSIANIGTVISDDRRVEAYRGIVELQHYFAEQLEHRRHHPDGGLISDLVHAHIDTDPRPDGTAGPRRPLEMAEMLSILQQLLVAGNETTTKALTEGIHLLATHPEVWAKLRADPAGYAPLVTEEVLRLSTPTQGMFRVATRDVELEGVTVPKGARVVVVYSGANRDPAVWGDDPDRFDPDRPNLKEHLAFGKGIHFCLGAPLSRVEMQVAFERLARRIERIELLADQDLRYHPSFMLRGLVRLDARFVADHGRGRVNADV
jgi:cytochrome P450